VALAAHESSAVVRVAGLRLLWTLARLHPGHPVGISRGSPLSLADAAFVKVAHMCSDTSITVRVCAAEVLGLLGRLQVLSHCCHTAVTLLSHWCYIVLTLFLHCCYALVILLLHYLYTVLTLLLHCRYTVVTLFCHSRCPLYCRLCPSSPSLRTHTCSLTGYLKGV
jgi:hypothetical protein